MTNSPGVLPAVLPAALLAVLQNLEVIQDHSYTIVLIEVRFISLSRS